MPLAVRCGTRRAVPTARRVTGLLAVMLAALCLLGLAMARHRGLLGRLRQYVKAHEERWRLRRRTSERSTEPPFSGLAASQVGYAPGLRKEFTSPAAFGSFQVLSEPGGAVAFRGAAPVRRIETETLGPSIRSVWIGDFTALGAPGRYRIVADNGLSSHPFDVGPDVYDRPLRAVQRWFYYQRAFTAVVGAHAEGPWVHASDEAKAPPGVVKGWHDAGDLNLYNPSSSAALFWLLETYADFAPRDDDTNIPESNNGVPDILDEARWGLEWLLSMQDRDGGGFRRNACQGTRTRYGQVTPETAPAYVAGPVTVPATALSVGTLAYASTVYSAIDAAFAARCLRAAQEGYRHLETNRDDNMDDPRCPSGLEPGDPLAGRHERMYAAAGMLLATGEAKFRDEFERNFVDLEVVPNSDRVAGHAIRLYLRAPAGDPGRKRTLEERLGRLADEVLADGERNPFHWATYYWWGSINNGFLRASMYSARQCLLDQRQRAHCEQALDNLHYAFGRNYYRLSYVSGLPGVTRGMSWAHQNWLRALDAKPHVFPGMVSAGPNEWPDPEDRSYPAAHPFPIWGYWGDPANPRGPDTPLEGRFTDNDSWSTNEPVVNWQGSAVYMLHFARWLAKGEGVAGASPGRYNAPRAAPENHAR